MTAHRNEASVKIILALSLIHFIGDFYNAFVIPLLPVFIDKFSLTLAQAGLIAGLSRFLAFVVQPPVGYLGDRYPSRFFPLGGPLLVMVFIPLTGKLADIFTIRPVLASIAVIPVLTVLLIGYLFSKDPLLPNT